jgi:hypothetical protein
MTSRHCKLRGTRFEVLLFEGFPSAVRHRTHAFQVGVSLQEASTVCWRGLALR